MNRRRSIGRIVAWSLGTAILFCSVACDESPNRVLNASAGQSWVYIDPVQCDGNAWEKAGMGLVEYYESLGVEIHRIHSYTFAEVVCQACSCPTGERVEVLIDDEDVPFMLNEGFALV